MVQLINIASSVQAKWTSANNKWERCLPRKQQLKCKQHTQAGQQMTRNTATNRWIKKRNEIGAIQWYTLLQTLSRGWWEKTKWSQTFRVLASSASLASVVSCAFMLSLSLTLSFYVCVLFPCKSYVRCIIYIALWHDVNPPLTKTTYVACTLHYPGFC